MEGNEDVAKMLIDYNAEVDALAQVSIYTVRNANPNAKYWRSVPVVAGHSGEYMASGHHN